MTVNAFSSWLQHFGKFKGSEEVLFVLDVAKCHLDVSICDAAVALNIYIFCLPSQIPLTNFNPWISRGIILSNTGDIKNYILNKVRVEV